MIYIMCPANIASGGPELLHQLGYKLNLLGFDASMYYYRTKENVIPRCQCYEKYKVPYVSKLIDVPDNVIIIPEEAISVIHQIKHAKRVIWWLSVDNAYYTNEDLEILQKENHILHLSQSQYSSDYLVQVLQIPSGRIRYLSDYINSQFLVQSYMGMREDVVLFNPYKGFENTCALIAKADARIKWQALSGLTPQGMQYVMQRAKVYIDFGNHPGKDRIPREAALCGCCIITNKKGSAANSSDVDIDEKYKFDENAPIEDIIHTIYDLVENYPNRVSDYSKYVKKTKQEFVEFEKDVLQIFSEMVEDRMKHLDSCEEYLECMLKNIQEECYEEAFSSLVSYRAGHCTESVELDIIETNIRIGIGEYPEAKYCAFRGLEKDSTNYELYYLLATITYLTEKTNYEELRKYCDMAIEYSKDTEDALYIRNICENYLNGQ